ncbi:MAG: hypothetical protein ABIH83_04925 [Candidatus Micrarchaeota archaeon]
MDVLQKLDIRKIFKNRGNGIVANGNFGKSGGSSIFEYANKKNEENTKMNNIGGNGERKRGPYFEKIKIRFERVAQIRSEIDRLDYNAEERIELAEEAAENCFQIASIKEKRGKEVSNDAKNILLDKKIRDILNVLAESEIKMACEFYEKANQWAHYAFSLNLQELKNDADGTIEKNNEILDIGKKIVEAKENVG